MTDRPLKVRIELAAGQFLEAWDDQPRGKKDCLKAEADLNAACREHNVTREQVASVAMALVLERMALRMQLLAVKRGGNA
jgi:hypothetical protein